VALVLAISGQLVWAYNVINFCAAAIFFFIPGAIITMRKGYSPAKYFLLAFTIFIGAVVVFVMKDAGVIPYNAWTFFALPLGSAIEMVLLSLALASRINQLKKESAHAREEQLRISQINERMVREQNTKLEERVRDRTADLQEVNANMRTTLEELQSAQQQLVQSEKLASIGQLTAGIAHELNNPINFVSSSAQSLRRDFEDLNAIIDLVKAMDPAADDLNEQVNGVKEKLSQLDIEFTQQEIEELLNGIEDGTIRTSEIVKGLRIFSRMDGDNFIQAQLNELIESTLIVLRSNFKDAAVLQMDLGEEMPPVMCQPGRLNQVFMNIITNAIQAMELLGRDAEENVLSIVTDRVESIGQAWAEVRIKDAGPGMSEAVTSQIFDPFFTTKPVGEGTGLGLSIVMGILRDHNAEVEVESEEGVGTEFIIRFPL
jgi:two-component system NtrC family sensor kinase